MRPRSVLIVCSFIAVGVAGYALLAPSGAPRLLAQERELNVIEQVSNLCRISVVEEAWRRGQSLAVHGLIYGLHDGILRDLDVSRSGPDAG